MTKSFDRYELLGFNISPVDQGSGMPELMAVLENRNEIRIRRLQRKLDRQKQRIEGLQKYIAELEHAFAMKDLELKRLPRDVTRAVQEALCNIRMIPVHGIGGSDKIVEIHATKKP